MITRIRLHDRLDELLTTYWFVPLLMAICAALLAGFFFWLDGQIAGRSIANHVLLYRATSAEIHDLLRNIVSSGLGLMGILFSVTLVPLSIAASQFGWIVLRFFFRDRGIQVVLGLFTAVVLYAALLDYLIALKRFDDVRPYLSVNVALLLALTSLGALLYFFNHVATLLQGSSIVARAGVMLERAIEVDYPATDPQPSHHEREGAEQQRAEVAKNGMTVAAKGTGYVRTHDEDLLMRLAVGNRLVAFVERSPGEFVVAGDPLLRYLAEGEVDEKLVDSINAAFLLGDYRTPLQDTEFGFTSLVAMAVRALSPGINDPFTAFACIDRLAVGLSRIAERHQPSPYTFDQEDNLRLIIDPVSFRRLTNVSFNQIREYGAGNPEIMIRLLRAIATIATRTNQLVERKALLHHTEQIEQSSKWNIPPGWDRDRVHQTYAATVRAIGLQNEGDRRAVPETE